MQINIKLKETKLKFWERGLTVKKGEQSSKKIHPGGEVEINISHNFQKAFLA